MERVWSLLHNWRRFPLSLRYTQVIEVTDVFASDLDDFSAGRLLAKNDFPVTRDARDRSYVQSIRTFPRNLEIKSFCF